MPDTSKSKFGALLSFVKNYIFYFVVGAVIGFANVIPGVSGGTAMVVFGVYERIITIITDIRKRLKEELGFIIAVALGMGAAVFLFGSIMDVMLTQNEQIMQMFFIGVIVLSIPMIAKKALGANVKQWKLDLKAILPFAIVLAAMIFMATLDADALKAAADTAQEASAPISANAWTIIYMFICGVVGCATMIIPGISGSLVMVMMGSYAEIMAAIHALDFLRLIPFALGALFGLIFCAKLIRFLLRRFPRQSYSAILGFVIGSIFSIYPGWAYAAPVVAFALGGAAILACEWYGKKRGMAE